MNLSILGHGSDGSDGILNANHLRWSFPEKLGFPPGGFQLFRRATNVDFINCLRGAAFGPGETLSLPYDYGDIQSPEGFSMSLTSQSSPEISILEITESSPFTRFGGTPLFGGGTTYQAFHQPSGHLKIEFSQEVARIEVEFYIVSGSNFEVTAWQGNEAFVSRNITDQYTKKRKVAFSAEDCTAIEFTGSEIQIISLCVIRCYEEGSTWNTVTGDDFTLPNGNTTIPQHGIEGLQDPMDPRNDPDYIHALLRWGVSHVDDAPLTLEDFQELQTVMNLIQNPTKEEGKDVPVGWNLLPQTGDSAGEDDPGLNLSAYHLLLSHSLHPIIAKALGLYFTDQATLAGTYYDYKIEASWPEDHLADLEYKITFEDLADTGELFHTFPREDVIFNNLKSPEIEETNDDEFQNSHFLKIGRTGSISSWLFFRRPVKEVQLFVKHSGSYLRVYAHRNDKAGYVYERLNDSSGIIHLSEDRIDKLRILASDLEIHRIHYDFERCGEVELSAHVCGITQDKQLRPEIPTGLSVNQLPAYPRYDETGTMTSAWLAGLRWDAVETEAPLLLSDQPIAYLLDRKSPSGTRENVKTENSPLFIAPAENYIAPEGWPADRQYFLDKLNEKGSWSYYVASMDLWGRVSAWSSPASRTFKSLIPPPPEAVYAKYLDYSTYDSTEGTSTDPTLTADDLAVLQTEGTSGIRVTWKWTERLERACPNPSTAPNVTGFEVHFQSGFLNHYKGEIEGTVVQRNYSSSYLRVTASDIAEFPRLDQFRISVYRFYMNLIDPPVKKVDFKNCWLKQGGNSWLVVRSYGYSKIAGKAQRYRLFVQVPADAAAATPDPSKPFTIAVPDSRIGFIDFGDATNWLNVSVNHTEPFVALGSASELEYEVFLPNPAFPDPAFSLPEARPIRHAQIGVSSYNSDVQGRVSSPATITAVCRSAPNKLDNSDVEFGEATATAPDVNGKSTFHLRWKRANSNYRYNIYRTLDQALFRTDQTNIADRDLTFYTDFLVSIGYSSVDANTLGSKLLALETADYADLSYEELSVLANLPGNESAFSQVNAEAIDENDETFADRITEATAPGESPYSPDSNLLCYSDNTLDGRSRNTYFYRIEPVDAAGNKGELSWASPPVKIPQTAPPKAPVISQAKGGENEISVTWKENPDPRILGYNLYRTDDPAAAGDWRRMDLLLADETDTFTVGLETGETLSFTDETAIARTPYYYGVIAIGEDDRGRTVRSGMSKLVESQAWDLTAPEVPVWDEENTYWTWIDEVGNEYEAEEDAPTGTEVIPALILTWTCDSPDHDVMIRGGSETISDWEHTDSGSLTVKGLNPNEPLKIGIRSRSAAGLLSEHWANLQLEAFLD